jgi:membrane protein DedA with SNARE-associated domain
MDDFTRSTILFVQEHERWGMPIVFLLAFCESFALISLLVPATGILFGVGGLVAAADVRFWPIWFAAVLGAIAGDWLAYELAFHFKDRITQGGGKRRGGHRRISAAPLSASHLVRQLLRQLLLQSHEADPGWRLRPRHGYADRYRNRNASIRILA